MVKRSKKKQPEVVVEETEAQAVEKVVVPDGILIVEDLANVPGDVVVMPEHEPGVPNLPTLDDALGSYEPVLPAEAKIRTFEDLCIFLEDKMGKLRPDRESLNVVLCHLADSLRHFQDEILFVLNRAAEARRG